MRVALGHQPETEREETRITIQTAYAPLRKRHMHRICKGDIIVYNRNRESGSSLLEACIWCFGTNERERGNKTERKTRKEGKDEDEDERAEVRRGEVTFYKLVQQHGRPASPSPSHPISFSKQSTPHPKTPQSPSYAGSSTPSQRCSSAPAPHTPGTCPCGAPSAPRRCRCAGRRRTRRRC